MRTRIGEKASLRATTTARLFRKKYHKRSRKGITTRQLENHRLRVTPLWWHINMSQHHSRSSNTLLRGRNASKQAPKGSEVLINAQKVVVTIIRAAFIGEPIQATSKKQQPWIARLVNIKNITGNRTLWDKPDSSEHQCVENRIRNIIHSVRISNKKSNHNNNNNSSTSITAGIIIITTTGRIQVSSSSNQRYLRHLALLSMRALDHYGIRLLWLQFSRVLCSSSVLLSRFNAWHRTILCNALMEALVAEIVNCLMQEPCNSKDNKTSILLRKNMNIMMIIPVATAITTSQLLILTNLAEE